ncbi:hypothetical protein RJD38_21125 [Vibrio scophthalmi]|uniref:hypothetical protein n=1 Tax=Vibrio scophthalmi TaxID=45658 RepID=UPI00349F221D
MNSPKKTSLPKDIQAIERFGVCVFSEPIIIDGIKYTGARRVQKALVRDRIEAERWCKEEFGFTSGDGIIAGIASTTVEFGQVDGDYNVKDDGNIIGPLRLINGKSLAPDQIVSNFSYEDFTLVALLMGKTTPSPESEAQNSESSSNALVTEKSE